VPKRKHLRGRSSGEYSITDSAGIAARMSTEAMRFLIVVAAGWIHYQLEGIDLRKDNRVLRSSWQATAAVHR
jgi:hypothetical protein